VSEGAASGGSDPHPRVRDVLEASGAAAKVRRHADFGVPIRSPDDFARVLGYERARITKTLLLKGAGSGGAYCLAVLPAGVRANLAVAARHMGVSRCSMASEGELARVLDYPRQGVSPLGGEGLRVLLDTALAVWPTVLVGAGTAGVEIEIAPEELRRLTSGEWVELAEAGEEAE
jgi:Cys-tRNA(Pro)/Cys-tRNA(Cys) deacylase